MPKNQTKFVTYKYKRTYLICILNSEYFYNYAGWRNIQALEHRGLLLLKKKIDPSTYNYTPCVVICTRINNFFSSGSRPLCLEHA